MRSLDTSSHRVYIISGSLGAPNRARLLGTQLLYCAVARGIKARKDLCMFSTGVLVSNFFFNMRLVEFVDEEAAECQL